MNNVIKIILKSIVKLILGGLLIGFFHQYDLILAILLVLKITHSFVKNIRNKTFNSNLIFGFLLTAIIGYICEYFGTKYQYWEYHDVATEIPKWVFFAWGAAFILIYQTELEINKKTTDISSKTKKLWVLFIVTVFPTLGEIITINLGTWSYNVPYKVFGVPLAAIAALIIIHYAVNIILGYTSKKFGIKDLVFNP
ncbi:hypothetical protein ACSIGC_17735 [Tenacibaculum sp. ZS6-P6]|uniref:hypothetical protein n=1 Tax=Tenacibaculum sp. ZS6-P6 TaxID=3447503 RepID=UPI003F9943CB